MPQQQAPWLEGKYGWSFGEGGWNTGVDEDILKFSFMFDRNVDSVVASLPAAVNGQAHYLTTDNRLYFAVGTTYFSTPTPKWFEFKDRSTGSTYQFNGTSAVQVDSPSELDARLDAVELTVSNLGTAAFEDTEFFATQAELDVVEAAAQAYTDGVAAPLQQFDTDLQDATDSPLTGAGLVGLSGSTVKDFLDGTAVSINRFGAVGDGVRLLGGAVTTGTPDYTNSNNPFVASDVGKIIHVKGAGVAGAGLFTTISVFVSPGAVTLADNASTTVANAETVFGTDNTVAIQDAIDFAEVNLVQTELLPTPLAVYIPSGFFVTSGTLSVTEAVRFFGNGKSSHINNIAADGSDTLEYSTTKFLLNGGIKDVFLSAWTDAGHVLNFKFGVAFCSFSDLTLFASNISKSAIFADYTSFGGGSYDCEFSGGWYNGTRVGRTVPIVDVTANGTLWNEQVFRNLRIEGSEGTQAIRIKNVGAGTYLVNNRYENLNFEVCAGGGIYIESHRNYTIANISFWDNPTYTGDLISLGNGSGFATAAGVLMNIQRHGSALSGCVDIHFTNSGDSNLISFNTLAGTGPVINFNNRRVNVFGRVEGTLQNTVAITRFDALEGIYLQDAWIKSGSGSPESAVTAGRGSIFLRKDGGANTSLYVKESGTGDTGWAAYMKAPLTGSATYDPPSLADGAGVNTTVTVTGAFSGDAVLVSFSNNLSGITLTGYVSATDTVTARFQNESGGVVDLASGTLRAWVIKA
jgi:hypothetical protein